MRHRMTLGLVTVSAALLAGCQAVPEEAIEAAAYECPVGEEGCDEVKPVGPGGEMTVVSSREEEYSFTVVDGAAPTGEITVQFENEGDATHNVEPLGAAEGTTIPQAPGGGEETGTFLLFPGEWTIICNIPGHRAAGMEATIEVFATEEEAAAAEAEDAGADSDELDGGEGDDAAGGEGDAEGSDDGAGDGDTTVDPAADPDA